MTFIHKNKYDINDLLHIMEILRAPDGCPWDRQQTHESIRRNFIEETYEAVEAIDSGDTPLLLEELGDVLLQVVFHTQMEREKGSFDFDGVCDGICKKLIVRHPHIFADVQADTPEQVLANWDAIKKREKKQDGVGETLQSVPKVLPALMRSEKVQHRAEKAGFCYENVKAAMKDMHSEIRELEQAIESGDKRHIFEELGDLLFSVVNVSRHIDVDAEEALGASCDKFISRVCAVEDLAVRHGHSILQVPPDMLDSLWQEAKNKEL